LALGRCYILLANACVTLIKICRQKLHSQIKKMCALLVAGIQIYFWHRARRCTSCYLIGSHIVIIICSRRWSIWPRRIRAVKALHGIWVVGRVKSGGPGRKMRPHSILDFGSRARRSLYSSASKRIGRSECSAHLLVRPSASLSATPAIFHIKCINTAHGPHAKCTQDIITQ
jgi:hypothetical protein